MILTCPQCATHFEIDESLIGDAGKKLRCSQCGHIWFYTPNTAGETDDTESQPLAQAPAQENQVSVDDASDADDRAKKGSLGEIDKSIDAAIDFDVQDRGEQRDSIASAQEVTSNFEVDTNVRLDKEKNVDYTSDPETFSDIRDSKTLKDIHVEDVDASDDDEYETSVNIHRQALEEKTASQKAGFGLIAKSSEKGKKNPVLITFLSAGITFVILIALSLLLQPFIIAKIPMTKGYYHLLGAQPEFTGGNIAITNLKAELKEGVSDIEITAEFVNSSDKTSEILPILAEQLDSEGKILERWIVMPSQSQIAAHEALGFKAHYILNDDADTVRLGFTQDITNEAKLDDAAQVVTLSASTDSE